MPGAALRTATGPLRLWTFRVTLLSTAGSRSARPRSPLGPRAGWGPSYFVRVAGSRVGALNLASRRRTQSASPCARPRRSSKTEPAPFSHSRAAASVKPVSCALTPRSRSHRFGAKTGAEEDTPRAGCARGQPSCLARTRPSQVVCFWRDRRARAKVLRSPFSRNVRRTLHATLFAGRPRALGVDHSHPEPR